MKILDLSVFDKKFTVRDGLRCWLFQISVLSASDLFLRRQTGGWKGRRGRSGIQKHKHTATGLLLPAGNGWNWKNVKYKYKHKHKSTNKWSCCMQKISKAQTHLRILLAGLESKTPPSPHWGQDYPYFWGKVLFEVILNSGARLFKTYHPPPRPPSLKLCIVILNFF